MDLMPPLPQIPRPVRPYDLERRLKLLNLADALLEAEPTEASRRTVRYMCRLAEVDVEPAPLPRLSWILERSTDEFDALLRFDGSSIGNMMSQLIPQMRFSAKFRRVR